MKIEDLLSQLITPKTPEAKPAAGEANFAQQLQEVMAAAQGTAESQAPSALGNISAISQVSEVNSNPGEVLNLVLSHLDSYQQALSSSNVPLKQVASLVQTL